MKAAFIIGCASYDDPDIANLNFSGKDAEDFATVIAQNCGFSNEDIIVLSSNQSDRRFWPTKSNIIRALKPRPDKKSRLSTLFFFFSGHGLHSSRDGRDYLVPQDAAANELEDSSIAFEKILEYLQGWPTNNLVLFLDACRAVVQGGKAVNVEEWQEVNVKALHSYGMASLCSCSPYQKSYESDELRNGIFTYGLCEALSDRGKCRTLYELNNYLVNRVPAISRKYRTPVQTPYTRIEPVDILQIDVVSEQRISEWQLNVAIGKEVRGFQPASSEFAIKDAQHLMCAVDFGTSFSSIALLDQSDNVVLIPSPKGRYLVPSVVSFFSNLDYVVGWAALENAKVSPDSTVFSVKRFLGSSKIFNIYGKSLTPEFIACLILRSLKRNAEEYSQTTITRALVSAPANFDIVQTNALVRAFELGDLDVYRVIGEPCASTVAFYTGFQNITKDEQLIIVLDLGGGTFDVSIMSVGGKVCQTLAVVGDNDLGGIDYDTAIHNYVMAQVQSTLGIPYEFSEVDIAQISAESERVKVALGSAMETSVVIQNFEVDDGDLLSFSIPINRDLFRQTTYELNARVESCILRALKLAELAREDRFNSVFLAGQGAKIFTVREAIEKLFPNIPIISKLQETAVIQGLCTYSGVLRGPRKDLLLLDTNYCAIGVKCIESKTLFLVNSPTEPRAELLFSGNEDENKVVAEVLPLTTTIPTLAHYTCKVTNIEKGKVRVEIVEINTFGEAKKELVGTVEVEVLSGDEFGLTIEVDAYRTINLIVSNFSSRTVATYQVNNLFHTQSSAPFKNSAPLAAREFEFLPVRRIKDR